jgi:hypothetical protein
LLFGVPPSKLPSSKGVPAEGEALKSAVMVAADALMFVTVTPLGIPLWSPVIVSLDKGDTEVAGTGRTYTFIGVYIV